MLEKVKHSLGITSSVFDEEITANIETAVKEMGCTTDITNLDESDSLISKAIITYCAWQHNLFHGNSDLADKFKTCYDEQKKQLLMASGYTTWSV